MSTSVSFARLITPFSRKSRSSRRPRRKLELTPQCEQLEIKIAPATLTWTGGGGNALWSTISNWTVSSGGQRAPSTGDSLVFPADSGTNGPLLNNLNGLQLASIDIQDAGYDLNGSALSLSGDLTYSGSGSADYEIPTVFTGSGTISTTSAPLNVEGQVTLNADETFDVGASAQLTLSGGLTGTGAIAMDGPGALVVLGTSYTGSETVSGGVLIQITPYSAPYDGASHSATGTATIPGGDDSGKLNLGGTSHKDAATYSDPWTYYNGVVLAYGTISDVINQAPVTATIVDDPSKPYDGTMTATLSSTNYDLAGLASGEGFTVTQTSGTYNDPNVQVATTVTASLSAEDFTPFNGTLASNYTLPTTASGAGTITPATVTIAAVTDTKSYDGTTASSQTPTFQVTSFNTDLGESELGASTLYNRDAFTTLSESFDSANAGSGTLTASYSIGGNYTVTSAATAAGTITPASLTISAVSDTKVYDGTLASSETPTYQVTGLAADTLYGTGTVTRLVQAYQSKDVLGVDGSTLLVTAYQVNDGNGGADYTVTPETATGTITPAALTISAVSDTKVYDGTTSSSQTPTYQVTGLAADTLYVGDSFTSLGEAFQSKNALGDGVSTLTVNYLLSDGNPTPGANYAVTPHTATGTITPAAPTVSVTDAGGTYSTEPFPATDPSVTGVGTDGTIASFGDSSLSYSYYSGATLLAGAPRAAGAYTVVANYTSNNPNYADANSSAVNFTIAQAAPTVRVTDAGGTYNTDPFPATGASVTGVGTDGTIAGFTDLSLSYSYYSGTTLLAGALLAGAPTAAGAYTVLAHYASDNGNYTSADSSPVGFSIAQAALTITANSVNMTYADGTTLSGTNFGEVGLLSGNGDTLTSVSLATSATTSTSGNWNAGTWTITPSAASGSGLSNYTITYNTGTLTVAQATATVTFDTSSLSWTYDGSAHFATATTVPAGLTLDFAYQQNGTPVVNPTNAGDYDVTATIDDANYQGTASDVLHIARENVTAAIVGDPTKTYNGNTNATLTPANFSLSGLISGESFTVTPGLISGESFTVTQTAGTYNSKDVATATTVTASLAAGDFTPVGGTLASNYDLPTSATGTGHITAATISGSFTAAGKVYDGGTSATILTRSFTTTPFGTDNLTLVGGTASFADKNVNPVGTPKTVTGTGFTLGGTDAGNYQLASSTLTTTANITARAVTVTADAKTKVFGQADPALTYKVTTGSLVAGDSFSGSLTRAPGQSVGSYPIQQGTLKLSSNYNLTYVGANLTITKAQAAITIASSASSTVYGQVLHVNVHVYSSSGVGTPTGTVNLYDGNVNHEIGQASLSGSIASFQVSTLGLGGHSLLGVYMGDATFNSVVSAALPLTVNPAFTTTTIVSQRSGSGYELTAKVAVNSPGGGTPTGTVTFVTGNRNMGTVAVVNGLAKLFEPSKLALRKWFTGSFLSSNGNYKASSGSVYVK